MNRITTLEICAGAGGQSLGLEMACVQHAAAVELDRDACATLRLNRPDWRVIERDVRDIDGRDFRGIDLLSGGVPCPPFSVAGRQLGAEDERDLFPEALRIVAEARPAAVMLENVRGLASSRFRSYRKSLLDAFWRLGYQPDWRLLNASEFGVPQLRPRFVLVAIKEQWASHFVWPETSMPTRTVGDVLVDLMAEHGWSGAAKWSLRAARIAPTIVGGSKKHGGPDLGPTRARREWLKLGVDGRGIADDAPREETPEEFAPRLTLRMVARLQGFPDDWQFAGKKTSAYRQIGNAFPPPVACAVAERIVAALSGEFVPAEQQQLTLQQAVLVPTP